MNRIFLIFFLGFSYTLSYAQIETETERGSSYHASVQAQGVLTSKDHVPFWLRSNQFGSIPLPGISASFIGMARKDYDTVESLPTDLVSGDRTRLFDWGASLELRQDIGQGSRTTLIEGYAKVKVSIFELKAGRVKEMMGLVDTTLSSGAFSVSGNALGIPQVQLSIPNYWSIPLFGELFAVKGNFAHGWLGDLPRVQPHGFVQSQTFFHQSSFYARLGRPDWRLHLFGGFNHQAYWGRQLLVNSTNKYLSDWKTYTYVVMGKTYAGSKIGNHLGSIDVKMEYDFDNVRLAVYRQNFYDEGALAKLANIKDGLNGISLLNKAPGESGFQWHKFLVELFYSKDQAGYPNSKLTKSGDENYYNNNEYEDGWSYKGLGVGNPFITTSTSTRAGLPNDPTDYFNNNRVVAWYAGMEGAAGNYQFTAKASYSFNYGTFGTSKWGHSLARTFFPPRYGIWKEVRQFSAYLEVNRDLLDGWQAGCVAAFDSGGLFYNSSGLILKLRKSF
ncbi:MAG TPA: capsule assembly Wzi family protein [Puia sp.]|nr:capsule assembly Wzi family protein [Puia sp.]